MKLTIRDTSLAMMAAFFITPSFATEKSSTPQTTSPLPQSSIASAAAATEEAVSSSENSSTLSLPLKDIQRFATAVAQIKRYYVKPVSDETLFTYAIEGMLSNLDPHSAYLDAEELQDLQTTTVGKFGGIGIEVIPQDGFIKVISPIDDTPAYKAGIKAGDMIIRINNKLVKDMTLRDAINLIRGEPGSKVNLVIIRTGEKKPLQFNVTREIIQVHTVKSEILENGYGYIRLSFFQASTNKDLLNAINKLKQESGGQLKGIIIDLRNNPGGLLDSAIDITDDLLDSSALKKYDGLIVYTKGRIPDDDIKAKATPGDVLKDVPIVVLINEGSASASEIVAGALQDYKRALVLGKKSFGKGSVQTVLPIDNHTGIKLTTALYYTPAGRSIQAKGIEPDISIPEVKISNPDDSSISIAEADLNKHLNNGNDNNPDQKDKQDKKDSTDTDVTSMMDQAAVVNDKNNTSDKKISSLLRSDFQVYEALMILKSISQRHTD